MRILMFGWEFPPFSQGGLGTACFDLTKGLSRQGVQVSFVMPYIPEGAKAEFVKLIGANNLSRQVKFKGVKTLLAPYITSQQYYEVLKKTMVTTGKANREVYGKNLYEEVYRYGLAASVIAETEPHDVIHAHDWMTYKAAMEARKISGKPLVVHIHATEFDRTGGNPNQYISHIEYEGLAAADMIIANSQFTKNNVMCHYKIPDEKIRVVHWGIDPENPIYHMNYSSPLSEDYKIVLFLGRITLQKGPDYFVEVAHRVGQYMDNVKFMVVGGGDMLPRMVDRVAELGMADKFMFGGWAKGNDVHRAFQMADLYVMPSVSEPFGLVALESLKNSTPIIISKQSGVSEVLNHALKVDFWDIEEMTNKIVNVLSFPELYGELHDNSVREIGKFNLDEPARKCIAVYQDMLSR